MHELPKKELVFPTIALPPIIPDNAAYLDPDPFYGPSEFPLTLQLPEFYFVTVVVRSAEVTVTCLDDYPGGDVDIIGDPVTVLAGSYTTRMYPSDIPSMSNLELETLAGLSQATLDDMVNKSPAELQAAPYHLAEQTADVLYTTLNEMQAELDEAAHYNALALLTCYWENVLQKAECDEDMGYPNEDSIVLAGTVRSLISQQAADEAAYTIAADKLVCVFGNPEVTVTCHDLYPTPPTPPDYDPADPPPPYPQRDVLGDPVTVPAGSFTADTLAEAEALAWAYGLSQLDCYWVNEQWTTDCRYEILESYTVDEVTARTVKIIDTTDLNTIQRGLVVEIAGGVFVSRVSTDDANSTAEALGASLLDCKWESVEMETYVCGWFREDGKPTPIGVCDVTSTTCYELETVPVCDIPDFTCVPTWRTSEDCYVYGDAGVVPEDACALLSTVPEPIYIPPSDCVPVPWDAHAKGTLYRVVKAEGDQDTVFIPRGYAISYTSQLDANNLAKETMLSGHKCIYCNVKFMGTCPPAGLVPGFDPDTGIYPDGSTVSPPFDQWSLDATIGIEAGIICGPDYLAVLAQATSVANRTYEAKLPDAEKCQYGNDQLYISCIESTHPSGDRIYGHFNAEGVPQNPDFTPAGPALTQSPELSIDWRYAYPKRGEYITVTRNTFIATEATSEGRSPKKFANQLAIAYGLAIINCPVREW